MDADNRGWEKRIDKHLQLGLLIYLAGQIIATSHNLDPQKVAEERKWDPLFQGYLGW